MTKRRPLLFLLITVAAVVLLTFGIGRGPTANSADKVDRLLRSYGNTTGEAAALEGLKLGTNQELYELSWRLYDAGLNSRQIVLCLKALALYEHKGTHAVPAILDVLLRAESRVAEEAAVSLGTIGGEAAEGALVQGLSQRAELAQASLLAFSNLSHKGQKLQQPALDLLVELRRTSVFSELSTRVLEEQRKLSQGTQ